LGDVLEGSKESREKEEESRCALIITLEKRKKKGKEIDRFAYCVTFRVLISPEREGKRRGTHTFLRREELQGEKTPVHPL